MSTQRPGKTHHVTAPAKCWKIIVVVDEGPGDDLARITAETRVIAVIMPNDMSVTEDWRGWRVSVNAVEQLTGFRFFDRLPSPIQLALKAKVDTVQVRPPRPTHRGKE